MKNQNQQQNDVGGVPVASGIAGLIYAVTTTGVMTSVGFPFFFSVVTTLGFGVPFLIKDKATRLAALAAVSVLSVPTVVEHADDVRWEIESDPMILVYGAGGIMAGYAAGKLNEYESYGEEWHDVKEELDHRFSIEVLRENHAKRTERLNAYTTAGIETDRWLVQRDLQAWLESELPSTLFEQARQSLALPDAPSMPGRKKQIPGAPQSNDDDEFDWNDLSLPESEQPADEKQTAYMGGDFTDPVPFSVLEQVDLGRELAKRGRHIWLVATTQSGKTYLEYSILTHGFDESGGKAQAIVCDIKGSAFNGDCGIPDYFFSDKVADMPKHVEMLKKAQRVISARRNKRVENGGTWDKKPPPLYVVIPELNSFVKNLHEYDGLNPPDRKNGQLPLALEAGYIILQAITQWLEDNGVLIVDAQTSRVESFSFGSKAKIDSAMRNNLSMAAVSRNADYVGMYDFIRYSCSGMNGDPGSIIEYHDKNQPDKNVPIAATNIGSEVRVVQLPAIRLEAIRRDWKPVKDPGEKKSSTATANESASPDETVTDVEDFFRIVSERLGETYSIDDCLRLFEAINGSKAPSNKTEREQLGKYIADNVERIRSAGS